MKIRGDGRLGGISEVLGNRKWKASRTWSSKWVTTGHGKVDKVKLVTNKGPGSEGHWSGQEVRWRGDLSQGPNCSVNLGPVCMWRNEPEAKKCEDEGIRKKREFLHDLMVETLPFHCWGPRFHPWLGNWDSTSHMVWLKHKQTNKTLKWSLRMRVMGKREELTSQGGRASRQREGPKPGPRSQQEHGVFWNSEPGIRGTSQTTTDYTMGSVLILKEMVTCSFILFVPSTHNIGCLRANLEICYSPVLCSLVTSSILTAGNSQIFISRFGLCMASKWRGKEIGWWTSAFRVWMSGSHVRKPSVLWTPSNSRKSTFN